MVPGNCYKPPQYLPNWEVMKEYKSQPSFPLVIGTSHILTASPSLGIRKPNFLSPRIFPDHHGIAAMHQRVFEVVVYFLLLLPLLDLAIDNRIKAGSRISPLLPRLEIIRQDISLGRMSKKQVISSFSKPMSRTEGLRKCGSTYSLQNIH